MSAGDLPRSDGYRPWPPISWRAEIITFIICLASFIVGQIFGLNSLLARYVPMWVVGLLIATFGLFFMLRPGAATGSRAGTIFFGFLLVLLGASLPFWTA